MVITIHIMFTTYTPSSHSHTHASGRVEAHTPQPNPIKPHENDCNDKVGKVEDIIQEHDDDIIQENDGDDIMDGNMNNNGNDKTSSRPIIRKGELYFGKMRVIIMLNENKGYDELLAFIFRKVNVKFSLNISDCILVINNTNIQPNENDKLETVLKGMDEKVVSMNIKKMSNIEIDSSIDIPIIISYREKKMTYTLNETKEKSMAQQKQCEEIKRYISEEYNLQLNDFDLFHEDCEINLIEELYDIYNYNMSNKNGAIKLFVKRKSIPITLNYQLKSKQYSLNNVDREDEIHEQPHCEKIKTFVVENFEKSISIDKITLKYEYENDLMEIDGLDEIYDLFDSNIINPIVVSIDIKDIMNLENDVNDNAAKINESTVVNDNAVKSDSVEVIEKDKEIKVSIDGKDKMFSKNKLCKIPLFANLGEGIGDAFTFKEMNFDHNDLDLCIKYFDNKKEFWKTYKSLDNDRKSIMDNMAETWNFVFEEN
eukprot:254467_1